MDKTIDDLITQMTVEEKASMCSGLDFWHLTGIERLEIPSVMVTDGPHGIRKQEEGSDHLGFIDSVPATCFPAAVSLASTWNRSLIEEVGKALGEEAQAEGVGVLLGPGVNIKRSPLCGRNFEYFSEDPYLSSEIAASHITGVQSKGVGTSLKHFAVNNQEHRRMTIDAVVDERTLREIYLASFEGAVKKAKPWTVMSAYNKVNGDFASENRRLLTDILKEEWGFEGVVVSDWGAVNERAAGLQAGLELEMPASYGIGKKKILDAIENGELSEATLDAAVERLLKLIFNVAGNKKDSATYDRDVHHLLAKKAAAEGIVLLKNDNGILPLNKQATLAVIGELAVQPRYQGGGSSHINPTRLDKGYEEIRNTVFSEDQIRFSKGYSLDADTIDRQLIEEAKEAAQQAEVAVLFIGLPDRYESEGYDRKHLRLPENQQALIEEVAAVQPNVIVVLNNGAPIEMPWLQSVKGLIEGYLGGQAGGSAVADVLFGGINPSGKLAETFPVKLSDNPSFLNFPGEGDRVEYKEGIFVGYRYYDTKEIEPLFPFGFGLSYTSFEYSSLTVSRNAIQDTDTLKVEVTVKNTGQKAGKEVVQLYVKSADAKVIRPEKELKGFEKVALDPGEEKTVSFTLDKRSFAYYNPKAADWRVDTGEFELLIGKSSRDIALKDTVTVESTDYVPFTVGRNTTVGELQEDPDLSDLTVRLLEKVYENNPLIDASGDSEESADMIAAMMKNMPLRALSNFSMGTFTEEMLSDMISELNEAKMQAVKAD